MSRSRISVRLCPEAAIREGADQFLCELMRWGHSRILVVGVWRQI